MRFTLPSKSSAHWFRLHVANVMRLDLCGNDDGVLAGAPPLAAPLGCLRSDRLTGEEVVDMVLCLYGSAIHISYQLSVIIIFFSVLCSLFSLEELSRYVWYNTGAI
jgi:hypothetical protein